MVSRSIASQPAKLDDKTVAGENDRTRAVCPAGVSSRLMASFHGNARSARMVVAAMLSLMPTLAAGIPVCACSIPVFRYALERFPADPYHFTVYYQKTLPADAAKSVDALRKLCEEAGPAANFDLKVVDLSDSGSVSSAEPASPGDGEKRTWHPPPESALPLLAVMLPTGEPPPIWSGPPDIAKLAALVDSPVRREVARRLLRGESAVFLLLQSGHKEEDAKVAQLLKDAIDIMHQGLSLPKDDGTGKPQSNLPLKISFSVIAVRRDDPAESFLVKTLLTAAQGLGEGPIVFPVFGRGRLLGAVAGKHLTSSTILDAGQFLCNGCSCTLKSELPGADLLLTADWDALLENRAAPEGAAELPGLAALIEAARAANHPPLAAQPAGDMARIATDVPPAAQAPPSFTLFYVVVATLTAVTGVVLLLTSFVLLALRRRVEKL
jgi:hypothetical protein